MNKTHERMLRIEDGVVSIEVEYEDHFVAQMAIEDMEDVGLLELAPPKDWKPACWYLNACEGIPDEGCYSDVCNVCIYRNMKRTEEENKNKLIKPTDEEVKE